MGGYLPAGRQKVNSGILIERTIAEHLAGLAPIDDVRASADYRRDVVRTLIARTLDAALQ